VTSAASGRRQDLKSFDYIRIQDRSGSTISQVSEPVRHSADATRKEAVQSAHGPERALGDIESTRACGQYEAREARTVDLRSHRDEDGRAGYGDGREAAAAGFFAEFPRDGSLSQPPKVDPAAMARNGSML
jgi:hypothetical protein